MANSKPTESSISQIQKPDKLLPSVPAGADKLSRRQAIQIATAAVVPSGAILSIPSAAEAGMSSLARSSSETNVPDGGREGPINVKWFGAEGNSDSGGTRGADDTSAIQAALNYIATLHGGTLYFPEGIYKITSYVTFPANVTLRGAGRKASKIVGTHAGGGGQNASEDVRNGSILYNAQTINTSTRIDVTIEDLWLFNSNSANQGAGIYQQSGVVLTVRNCEIGGCKWGIILDQSEDVVVDGCELGSNVAAGAGVWIINGPDLNANAEGGYSNIITLRSCMLNVLPSSRGIIDDGGVAHLIEGCNFVSGINGLRACDVVGLTLVGNYFESQTANSILLASTSIRGRLLGGSNATIIGGYITAASGHGAINGSGSPGTLTLIGGHYGGGGGKNPVTNAANFFQIYLLGTSGNGTEIRFTDGIAGGGGPHIDLSELAMDRSGNVTLRGLTLSPQRLATPTSNGQMTFELTNDTTLKIKVKGRDGTVRSTTLPLT